MRKRILINCFIIILVVLNIVNAQELCGTQDNPCKDNWENFGYANPNADISKIPPDKVDIQQVIANNRGKELTKEQIKSNFDKIDNLNDVDLERARKAIREKYIVTVKDFGESASLKNGVLKANFGEQQHVTLSSEVYKNGFLRITKNGEIVFIVDTTITEAKKLDIPKGDTLIAEVKHPVEFQNYKLNGKFKVNEDEDIIFLKEEKSTINGITVDSFLSDVNLCKVKSSCSGNYVFLGKDELVAQGNGFVLDFGVGNAYFDLDTLDRIVEKEMRRLIAGFRLSEFITQDSIRIYLGDFQEKSGKINIKTERDLLPLIKTDDFVKVDNGKNTFIIDGGKVEKSLSGKLQELKRSVPSSLIADGELDKIYIFDNNQNLHIKTKEDFEVQNEKRLQLVNQYGVRPRGYFSDSELDIFIEGLKKISGEFDVDFRKIGIDGKSLKINEQDKKSSQGAEAGVSWLEPYLLQWSPQQNLHSLQGKRVVGVFEHITPEEEAILNFYRENFVHEIGHTIEVLSNTYSLQEREDNIKLRFSGDFYEEWRQKAGEFGVEFEDVKKSFGYGYEYVNKIVIKSGPEYLFPPPHFIEDVIYSQTTITEWQAETFRNMVNNPKWFTDPKVPQEVRKQRQAFRDLYLEELKKYKK